MNMKLILFINVNNVMNGSFIGYVLPWNDVNRCSDAVCHHIYGVKIILSSTGIQYSSSDKISFQSIVSLHMPLVERYLGGNIYDKSFIISVYSLIVHDIRLCWYLNAHGKIDKKLDSQIWHILVDVSKAKSKINNTFL